MVFVYRTARHLIDKRGDDALAYAAMKFAEVSDKSDMYAYTAWKEILWAIEDILNKRNLLGQKRL